MTTLRRLLGGILSAYNGRTTFAAFEAEAVPLVQAIYAAGVRAGREEAAEISTSLAEAAADAADKIEEGEVDGDDEEQEAYEEQAGALGGCCARIRALPAPEIGMDVEVGP